MKKSSLYLALALVSSIPVAVSAQLDDTYDIIWSLGAIIDLGIGILSALALLVFIWGIVKYISSAGDVDKAKEGKSIMIYGVLALFVLFSIFGIIKFLQGEFFQGQQPTTGIPPSVRF